MVGPNTRMQQSPAAVDLVKENEKVGKLVRGRQGLRSTRD